MIKAKITKNIIHKGPNILGMPVTISQIIIAAIGTAAAIGEFFLLSDKMDINSLMSIIFVTLMLFMAFGVVKIQGMTLVKFIILCMKGIDKRPFCIRGDFGEEYYEEEPARKKKKVR